VELFVKFDKLIQCITLNTSEYTLSNGIEISPLIINFNKMTRATNLNQTVTFRMDKKTIKKLDKIAKLMDRPRSYFLKQGVANILDLYDWQLEKIAKGEEQVKQGRIATGVEVDKAFKL
jgi:predicted transcriptional regulator